jgi:hypothetical protein
VEKRNEGQLVARQPAPQTPPLRGSEAVAHRVGFPDVVSLRRFVVVAPLSERRNGKLLRCAFICLHKALAMTATNSLTSNSNKNQNPSFSPFEVIY